MRRSALALALTALLAAPAAPALAAPATKAVPVAAFDRLDVGGSWAVDLAVGSRARLTIKAEDPQDLANVEARAAGGTLTIGLKRGTRAHGKLTAVVATPRMARMNLAGAIQLDAKGFAGGALVLEGAGACKAKLAGRVSRLEVDFSGACGLDAEHLRADAVDLELSGACKAVVHALKALKVDASGVNRVEYLGDPKVESAGGWTSSIRKRQ